MSIPDVVRGSYFDVRYGDGGAPETFNVLCGLTQKTYNRQANTSEHFIADCADPEDVPDRFIIVTGQQTTISGEGRFNRSMRATIDSLFGVPNNYRFVMSEPGTDNINDGWYAGQFVLTALTYGGGDASNGDYATASFTFESTGPAPWVDA